MSREIKSICSFLPVPMMRAVDAHVFVNFFFVSNSSRRAGTIWLTLDLQMSEAVQGCQWNACNRVIRETANIVVSLAGVSN